MLTRCIAATVLTGLIVPAEAGPLRPRQVPADAQWVLHVDVEALLASSLGPALLEDEQIQAELEQAEEEMGIDPAEDLYSVTIFGDESDDEATVILLTSAAVDDALDQGREEPGYRRIELGEHVVHHWDEDDETMYAHVRSAPSDRRLVVLSDDLDRIEEAIEVLEGDAQSMRDARQQDQLPRRDLPKRGSLVYMLAQDVPWLDEDADDPAGHILSRSEKFRFDLSESRERLEAVLAISAESEGDAEKIVEILQGLVAFGQLVAQDVEELADLNELLDALEIHAEEEDVTVEISADVHEVIELMDALEELEEDDDEGHDW